MRRYWRDPRYGTVELVGTDAVATPHGQQRPSEFEFKNLSASSGYASCADW